VVLNRKLGGIPVGKARQNFSRCPIDSSADEYRREGQSRFATNQIAAAVCIIEDVPVMFDRLMVDVVSALRSLWASPAVPIAAVLTTSLAVAMNLAMAGLIDVPCSARRRMCSIPSASSPWDSKSRHPPANEV
jgi:hypothetical protein